jgi:hypothetical protein
MCTRRQRSAWTLNGKPLLASGRSSWTGRWRNLMPFATMVLERRTWGWSPLYHAFTKAEGGLPAHIKRPFLYTNDELSQMLT